MVTDRLSDFSVRGVAMLARRARKNGELMGEAKIDPSRVQSKNTLKRLLSFSAFIQLLEQCAQCINGALSVDIRVPDLVSPTQRIV